MTSQREAHLICIPALNLLQGNALRRAAMRIDEFQKAMRGGESYFGAFVIHTDLPVGGLLEMIYRSRQSPDWRIHKIQRGSISAAGKLRELATSGNMPSSECRPNMLYVADQRGADDPNYLVGALQGSTDTFVYRALDSLDVSRLNW